MKRGPAIMENAARFPYKYYPLLIQLIAVDRAQRDWNPALPPDRFQSVSENIRSYVVEFVIGSGRGQL